MSNLTDRAAYLRGLADGMNLDASKNENKLLLEMLALMDEMAQHIAEMDADVDELGDYVEEIDADLGEVEELLYGEDECCCGDDCDCCDDECGCDDECDCCECGDCEEISFQCPNCGKPVKLKTDCIDYEESPVCEFCGEPFFTDVEDDEDDEEEK